MDITRNNVYNVGIVSYNIHYNYSNYGSILQTYALQEIIKSNFKCINPIVIDYCPDGFADSNPYYPEKSLYSDTTDSSKKILSEIKLNEDKIREFIKNKYNLSRKTYYSSDFENVFDDEKLSGFICGSDAIWSIEYFKKFDKAFYGEYNCMKKAFSFAYAASFGETEFDNNLKLLMLEKMKNFKYIGLRESYLLDEIANSTSAITERVLDPTLLVDVDRYESIMSKRLFDYPYLLIYSRRFDAQMYSIAESIAKRKKLKIIDISLRNVSKEYTCMYSAGIEEFLSLVQYADFIITNSLHGTIFSVLMKKNFIVFPRIHGDKKIDEFLKQLHLTEKKYSNHSKINTELIDYTVVDSILRRKKEDSFNFLSKSLNDFIKVNS